jgi:hypothetical protein
LRTPWEHWDIATTTAAAALSSKLVGILSFESKFMDEFARHGLHLVSYNVSCGTAGASASYRTTL